MQKSFPLITQGSLETHLNNQGIIRSDTSKKNEYEVLKNPAEIFNNYNPALFNSRIIFYEPYGDPVKGQAGLETLNNFRRSILETASLYGFPNSDKLSEERKFDFKLSIRIWSLTKKMGFEVAQASNDALWNYLQGYLILI